MLNIFLPSKNDDRPERNLHKNCHEAPSSPPNKKTRLQLLGTTTRRISNFLDPEVLERINLITPLKPQN